MIIRKMADTSLLFMLNYSASRDISMTGYSLDHHNMAIIHFCNDLEKKLLSIMDFVVLQVGQYQHTPSEPA